MTWLTTRRQGFSAGTCFPVRTVPRGRPLPDRAFRVIKQDPVRSTLVDGLCSGKGQNVSKSYLYSGGPESAKTQIILRDSMKISLFKAACLPSAHAPIIALCILCKCIKKHKQLKRQITTLDKARYGQRSLSPFPHITIKLCRLFRDEGGFAEEVAFLSYLLVTDLQLQ